MYKMIPLAIGAALVATGCKSVTISGPTGSSIEVEFESNKFRALGDPNTCIQAVNAKGQPVGEPIRLDGEGQATGDIPAGARGVIDTICPPEDDKLKGGGFHTDGLFGGGPPWHEVSGSVFEEGLVATFEFRVRAVTHAQAVKIAVPLALASATSPPAVSAWSEDVIIDSFVGTVTPLSHLGLPAGDTLTFSFANEAHAFFGAALNDDDLRTNPEMQLAAQLWLASASVPAASLELQGEEAIDLFYSTAPDGFLEEASFAFTP